MTTWLIVATLQRGGIDRPERVDADNEAALNRTEAREAQAEIDRLATLAIRRQFRQDSTLFRRTA